MEPINALAFCIKENQLFILDQTLLPKKKLWIVCNSLNVMVEAIQQLRVRGAPLIGIVAALFIATEAFHGLDRKVLINHCEILRDARPTAVNLMYCMDYLLGFLNNVSQPVTNIVVKAYQLFKQDVQLCEKIANFGAALIRNHTNIMTYCNTGSLATAGYGTALGVIRKAHLQNKQIHVWINETRPLLQGARLTSWECIEYGIACTVLCDNMAASLMQQNKIDCVIVGADRIAQNGDFANKIGTYALAIAAKIHNVPFYVAAPTTTCDISCGCGDNIIIEQREDNEVFNYCLDGVAVHNPAFDVTPAHLVTAYILNNGVTTSECLPAILNQKF